MCIMSDGFIRLCSMVFCWAAISACHALLSSHLTNKDDDENLKSTQHQWNNNTQNLHNLTRTKVEKLASLLALKP